MQPCIHLRRQGQLRFYNTIAVYTVLFVGLSAIILGGSCRNQKDTESSLDDLSTSAEEIFRACVDVAEVETVVTGFRPTHRIVQICDSHYVPREKFDSFANIVSRVRNHRLTAEAIHEWHQEYADEVERFHASQAKLLYWLTDNYGLDSSYKEGIYYENLLILEQRIALFRKLALRGDPLKREIRQMRHNLRNHRDPGVSADRQKTLEEYRELYLNMGAVSEVLVARPSLQVLPAEDKEAYESARRDRKNGGRIFGPHFEARNAAIVRRLLANGPCAVVVLGSAHNLTKQVKRLGDGRCEYIRVTPKKYPSPLYIGRGKAAMWE